MYLRLKFEDRYMVVATVPRLLTVVHTSYFVQIFISIGVLVHRNRGVPAVKGVVFSGKAAGVAGGW